MLVPAIIYADAQLLQDMDHHKQALADELYCMVPANLKNTLLISTIEKPGKPAAGAIFDMNPGGFGSGQWKGSLFDAAL